MEEKKSAEEVKTEKKAPKKKKGGQTPYIATGRRKNATARVRVLIPGSGRITVNKRAFESYFTRETNRLVIQQPLKITDLIKKIDIAVIVDGGGLTGQAEATRHGIARALAKQDVSLRTILKKNGFLTRDPRSKERKKYGRKRARKRFQFSKR